MHEQDNFESDNDVLVRPMAHDDLPAVYDLLDAIDPEEGEEARETFERGWEDIFVLDAFGMVAGLAGFEFIDGTDRTVWVEWPAIDTEAATVDVALLLIEHIVRTVGNLGARRAYVRLPQRTDGDPTEPVWTVLRQAFEAAGFGIELTHNDYYEPGEAMLMLGRNVESPDTVAAPPEAPSPVGDDRTIAIRGAQPLEETDDAHVVDWDFDPAGTGAGVDRAIAEARNAGARILFASVPSDAPRARDTFTHHGFRTIGTVKDFIADGVHETHLRLDINH